MLSRAGYEIDYEELIPEGAGRIIIAMHGFNGSKGSLAITMLQEAENALGTGLVKFDWPAHGRSTAEDKDLTVRNCLSDLDTVISCVREHHPGASLTAFATSYGGYITLLYAAEHPEVFEQIVLRSPALQFHRVLRDTIMTEDMKEQLARDGYFTCGFDRMIDVPEVFFSETAEHDLNTVYAGQMLPHVTIIHGDSDELVPYSDSVSFAREHGCALHTVPGADHRYTGEGQLAEAIRFAVSCIGSGARA